MTRQEQLKAELAALTKLNSIEVQREKNLTNRHAVYDARRAAVLEDIPADTVAELDRTDPAQQAFRKRQQAAEQETAAAAAEAEAQ